MWLNWFSTAFMVAQVLGASCMLLGLIRLIQGVTGDEGVRAVRRKLIGLLAPLLFGLLGLFGLLAVAFWEHSPITQWLKVVAPASTLLWMIWTQWTGPKIDAGALLETLIPLRPTTTLPPTLSEAIESHAWRWGRQIENREGRSSCLTGQAFLETTLQAIQASQELSGTPPLKDLSIRRILSLMRRSLADLYRATSQFPLGRKLTLSDWIYEGGEVQRTWGQGLSLITIGRALLNPLTLLDHHWLWRGVRVKPGELLERELSAWLHVGLFRLVSCHLSDEARLGDESEPLGSSVTPASNDLTTEQPHAQTPDPSSLSPQADLRGERPKLWTLLTLKMKAPLWLYLLLGGAAVIMGHGLWGVGAMGVVGALYIWSERSTFLFSRWQNGVRSLAELQRPLISRNEPYVLECIESVKAHTSEVNEALNPARPLRPLVDLKRAQLKTIGDTFRHPKLEDPILARLNAPIPDVVATAYFLCDDLYIWYTEGGLLPTLLNLAEKFGMSGNQERIERLFLEGLQSAATEASQRENIAEANVTTPDSAPSMLDGFDQKIHRWDDAIEGALPQNFLLKKGSDLLISSVFEKMTQWLTDELESRVITLYIGGVPSPPENDELTR